MGLPGSLNSILLSDPHDGDTNDRGYLTVEYSCPASFPEAQSPSPDGFELPDAPNHAHTSPSLHPTVAPAGRARWCTLPVRIDASTCAQLKDLDLDLVFARADPESVEDVILMDDLIEAIDPSELPPQGPCYAVQDPTDAGWHLVALVNYSSSRMVATITVERRHVEILGFVEFLQGDRTPWPEGPASTLSEGDRVVSSTCVIFVPPRSARGVFALRFAPDAPNAVNADRRSSIEDDPDDLIADLGQYVHVLNDFICMRQMRELFKMNLDSATRFGGVPRLRLPLNPLVDRKDPSTHGYVISQAFGGRLTHYLPNTFYSIDIEAPLGTPIIAPADATVVKIKDSASCATGIHVNNLYSFNLVTLKLDGKLSGYIPSLEPGTYTTPRTSPRASVNPSNTSAPGSPSVANASVIRDPETVAYLCVSAPGAPLLSRSESDLHSLRDVALSPGSDSNNQGGNGRRPSFMQRVLERGTDDPELIVEFTHIAPSSASSILKEGDRVSKGDVVALVGNIGFCPKPHVHMQVYTSTKPDALPIKFHFTDIDMDTSYLSSDHLSQVHTYGLCPEPSLTSATSASSKPAPLTGQQGTHSMESSDGINAPDTGPAVNLTAGALQIPISTWNAANEPQRGWVEPKRGMRLNPIP